MQKRCADIKLIIYISCLVILSGCGELSRERTADIIKARKPTSLAQAQVTHIGKEPLDQFISKRIALLHKDVSVTKHPINEDHYRFSSDKAGLAVAVSRKGYYLTAYHCVDDSGEYSLLPLGNNKLKNTRTDDESKQYVPVSKEKQESICLPIRIVWFSKKQDIALISTDKTCEWTFELVDSVPEPNTVVFAGGAWEHSAGHIVSIKNLADGRETFKHIKHNAPMVFGDSGGPLFSRDGILYGIHSYALGSVSLSLTGVKIKNIYSYDVSVDTSWIQNIIQEDQAKQKLIN